MNPAAAFSRYLLNPRATRDVGRLPNHGWIGRDAPMQVRQLLQLCPRHTATPLHQLHALAAAVGVGTLFAKDEAKRLSLGSFKALGGAYAVAELVLRYAAQCIGRSIRPEEIMSSEVREAVKDQVFCCATAGNHGRSVAAGARLFGCKAVIFVHQNVGEERRGMLTALDAQLVAVAGTYDDSVDICAAAARDHGWHLVSDTSWNDDSDVPAQVMRGYTVLVSEALAQMETPPTHVFVQGGVGGLAGAVAGYLADVLGTARPRIVVVEPDRAACLFASGLAGHPVAIPAGRPTAMAMLECYRPSTTAWPIVDRHVDMFMTLPDAAAIDAVRYLANPLGGDHAITAGVSGVVGVAGLVAGAQDIQLREVLALDRRSRVLTIITEGYGE